MKRQVVLDTETTGLKPEEGHRLVEIGAVELIDGVKTGRTFHSYINPERNIPDEVVAIHGITNEKVKDSPVFKDVADDFLKFIAGSELLIHNAKFDIGFLNSELAITNKGKLWDHVKNAVCTVILSKRLFTEEFRDKDGKKLGHKLDHLCVRLGVDNSHRELHGALLDADLLADVYIAICKIHSTEDIEADLEQTNWVRKPVKRFEGLKFKMIEISPKQEEEHLKFLASMEKKDKVKPVFLNSVPVKNKV